MVPIADLRMLEEDVAEDAYWSRVVDEAVREWGADGRPAGVSHEGSLARYGISPDEA